MSEGESAREVPGTDPATDRRPEKADREPVLPSTTSDEGDEGWGERPGAKDRDDDWYQRERPPHHEG